MTMKKLPLLWLTALALAGTVACSTNQSIGSQIDDTAITTKINAKMAGSSDVSAFNVDVDTQDGVVRLSGTVKRTQAKRTAARIARNTRGVRRVINDIEVGYRSVGDRFDDAAVESKIKAKLTGDASVNVLNVGVDSKDGVVTLRGRVESAEAKREAERIARETKGVERVRNEIVVIGGGR